MLKLVTTLTLVIGLAGCGANDPADRATANGAAQELGAAQSSRTAQVETESARLTEWLDARFEEQLDFSPIRKTMLGRKDDYDRIDDYSEAADDAQLEWLRQSVANLRRNFDYEALTPEAKTSYDLWVYQLDQAEAAHAFRRRRHAFHQMDGLHADLPQMLINFHRVDSDADMTAYVARLGEAGRAIGQMLERAELAASEGVHAPRFAYEAVIEQARAVTTGQPFDTAATQDSALWADITAKIEALRANGTIDETRAAELSSAAASMLNGTLKPSYDALIAWAESELPLTDAVATGVWKLPDGEAFYRERLSTQTTTNLTADEIHEIGLAEVARIQAEMETIKGQVGFDGTLREFFTFMREDPRFFHSNDDAGRQAYIDAATAHLDAIKARLPEFFGILPQADLIVKRVEAFREEPGGAQHYFQGTPDGSRPGIFYAHLIDMSSAPIPELEVVAYHEGLPGHHMQVSIAQELTGIPTFRTQAFFGAYIEGWALYSETLAKEMGAYDDPYSDFGRLATEIWRAIRLVVDTGLHAKGWTEEEAVAYFMANGPTSEGQIRSEIRRYIVLPGQATTYKIGMLEIQALRRRAESALGDAFDIREFHDTVLGGGALPLTMLERRVDEWIESKA